MTASLHRPSLPGPMLQRGFWLYVWRIETPIGQLLYVGRTGDNSSPHATAPYTRMGQHLGFQKTQNALRKHLTHCGILPEECVTFDLIAHGPIYAQVDHDGSDRDTLMERHKPLRDQVGTLEKLLCDGRKAGRYTVMNTVNCKWVLTEDGARKWQEAKEAFRQDFPELR